MEFTGNFGVLWCGYVEIIVQAQAEEAKPINLNVSDAVGELDIYWTCSICKDVVEDPCECIECTNLECRTCIKKHSKKTENRCPNCEIPLQLRDKVNRFVNDKLNNLLFKCGRCESEYKYEDRNKPPYHFRLKQASIDIDPNPKKVRILKEEPIT